MQITTIGLDLAKSVFQVHGVDASGQILVRKSLRRSQLLTFFAKLPSCLVGMEACGTSHYWARKLIKLGHEVRLRGRDAGITKKLGNLERPSCVRPALSNRHSCHPGKPPVIFGACRGGPLPRQDPYDANLR
jgi:hypothetical protein